MSTQAVAPVVPQAGRLTGVRSRRSRLSALEALERGFTLFRATFAREAWRYYTGAAPLVLCFIFMWVLNGQTRVSDATVLFETILLAAAYLLRVGMVSGYVHRVRERAFGVPRPKPGTLFAWAAALGRLLTWKLILSSAALMTLPTVAGGPWFYGACQFAGLEAGEDAAERHSLRRCLALAGQWYGGSVLLFLMLLPLWGAVWLNAFLLALIFPQLLQSIFGVNTLLSTEMGIYALLRSFAFWFSLFGGVWVALDPIVKCTFLVVYQHLRSREDGDDLRGILANLPRELRTEAGTATPAGAARSALTASLLVAVMFLLVGSQTLSARAAQQPASSGGADTVKESARQARVEKLRASLETESQRAAYRWHDAEHPTPPTWLERQLSRIGAALGRSWDALMNLLKKLWPRGLNFSPGGRSRGGMLKDLRFWLALVGVFTLAVGGVLIWLRRRRDATRVSVPLPVAPLPDLSNAAVASERSETEWFVLAEQLEGQGELKLALRAAYLGLLAGLAQREWVTIRRDRTNREYLDEFTRRWRRRPQAAVAAQAETPEKLRGSLRLFDRVWYGSYALTAAAVAAYRHGQRDLLNHV